MPPSRCPDEKCKSRMAGVGVRWIEDPRGGWFCWYCGERIWSDVRRVGSRSNGGGQRGASGGRITRTGQYTLPVVEAGLCTIVAGGGGS